MAVTAQVCCEGVLPDLPTAYSPARAGTTATRWVMSRVTRARSECLGTR